jgi:hypothetical protein
MKIRAFEFKDSHEGGFIVDPLRLKDGVNLFVGASGAGKTRLLNMFFNIGTFVASDQRFCPGKWTLHFQHKGVDYLWIYSGIVEPDGTPKVLGEELWIGTMEKKQQCLVSRSESQMTFKDNPMPRLPSNSTAIYLLREEPAIKGAYDAFIHMMRRRFSGEDLATALAFQPVPRAVVAMLERKADVSPFHSVDISLQTKLYLLHKYLPNLYSEVTANFKQVFPSVEKLETHLRHGVKSISGVQLPVAGDFPIALVSEGGVQAATPLVEMSSGMQKVLLIICDVLTTSSEVLYMIDEYENSLGINAIDFLPGFLNEYGTGKQFLITSHHPNLINSLPVDSWYVLNRRGTHIRVKYGKELEERYGKSKQQKFIQLINDPFFADTPQ